MTDQQNDQEQIDPIDQFKQDMDRVVNAINAGIAHFTKVGDALEDLLNIAKMNKRIPLSTLGVAYFNTKDAYDAADKQVKRVYHFQDALNKFLLPERMREGGTDGFRVPEIARSFSIVEKTSASFIDKEKGLEWLREIGQGDMIQETVNAGTLASFCRNMLLEEGREPPEDVVKVSTYSTTSMTKYRPKKGEL